MYVPRHGDHDMIASLMMYRRPELEAAHDRYWALIRSNLAAGGIDSPQALSQDEDEFVVWRHPELVLSQTCGMPYRLWLHDEVTLVGTPDFGIEGCPPGYYRSPLVVRASDERSTIDEFRGARFAYNQTFSQSGFAAVYNRLVDRGWWFDDLLHTDQHLRSARSVAEGHADIAALDAVSWRLMEQYEPFAADLRVLEWTDPTPGLPLITAMGNDADAIFAAVERSIGELTTEDRARLGLVGLVRIAAEDYLAIPTPPGTAGSPAA